MFQFLYGAIKSGLTPGSQRFLFNFNSSMVRLKVTIVRTVTLYSHYFNSSMVRLKGGGGSGYSTLFSFQFLYGAIKSGQAGRRKNNVSNFNSSMVRLKVACRLGGGLESTSFQFLYGAIKSGRVDGIVIATTDFNSSMVRLKEQSIQQPLSRLYISIPLWCD